MNEEDHRFDTAGIDYGKHRFRKRPRGRSGRDPLPERRVPRWVYRVIAILILSALAVLGWYNRVNFQPANVMVWVRSHVVGFGIGDGFPSTFSGSSVAPGNFLSCNKDIVIASDTNLAVYNSTAKELLNRQHSYSQPVLKVNGSRALLYSLGGKECRIETVGGSSQKITADQEILAGALSADGKCALVTGADGYCGKLTVYTSDSKVQSYYWFSDYYPSAVALNPEGTQAAVAGVSAKNGELISAVYLINLNSGKTEKPFAVYSGNLLHAIYWDTDSTVVAIGDTAASVIHVASRTKQEISYGDSELTAYCSDSGRTALGLSAHNSASGYRLLVCSKNGAQILARQFSESIQSISLYGDTVAALSNGKVHFYPLSAAAAGSACDAGKDARAVALRDESSAYVLGISEIRLVNNR